MKTLTRVILEKKGRCWKGYRPTPGKKPYSKGSCMKVNDSVNPLTLNTLIEEGLFRSIKDKIKSGVGQIKAKVKSGVGQIGGAIEAGGEDYERGRLATKLRGARGTQAYKNALDFYPRDRSSKEENPFLHKVAVGSSGGGKYGRQTMPIKPQFQKNISNSDGTDRYPVELPIRRVNRVPTLPKQFYMSHSNATAGAPAAATKIAKVSPREAARVSKLPGTQRFPIGSGIKNKLLRGIAKGTSAALRARDSLSPLNTNFQHSTDDVLIEKKSPAWQRKAGKNPSGGLNAKGVASYRAANPGSKLKTAVTTKPSKLKKGSKAAKRRKSFCARMSGMKKKLTGAKTKKNPNSRINKSLRKWNC